MILLLMLVSGQDCVDKSTENLVDFDGNWVDGFEQCTDVEAVVLVA